MEAHLYASQLIDEKKENRNNTILYPAVGLIASGGHSTIFLMKNMRKYRKIGMTIDDAAGEAFDKVAAILGLSYPGGPSIEKIQYTGIGMLLNSQKVSLTMNRLTSVSVD